MEPSWRYLDNAYPDMYGPGMDVAPAAIPSGTEWALHACVLLSYAPGDGHLPAAKVAEFYDLPAAYLAKHLQALTRAGIVESTPGRAGGFRLARPAEEITVLQIVDAVAAPPLFECREIRRRGPVAAPSEAYVRRCGIAGVMARAERAWRAELAVTTLADLRQGMVDSTPVEVRGRAGDWLQAAAR